MKRRGFTLIEIIIVIAIIVSIITYHTSFFTTTIKGRSGAYQLKYMCDYTRKYSCSTGQSIKLYIKKRLKTDILMIRDSANHLLIKENYRRILYYISGKDKNTVVPINDMYKL